MRRHLHPSGNACSCGLGTSCKPCTIRQNKAPHAKLCTCSGMVRIYKEYNLALHSNEYVQKRVVSSSYPGELSSDDGAATKLTFSTAALPLNSLAFG